MEYSYKIYLKNGNYQIIDPLELKGKSLDFYDRYYFFGQLDNLINKNGIMEYQISAITILCKNNNKYTQKKMINRNPYYNDIYYYLKDKEINMHGKKTTIRVIDSESECFKEMKDYLFNQLENNPNFLTEVYNVDDKLSELFNKYIGSYKSQMSDEDYHNTYQLKSLILKNLSAYVVYRTLTEKRYEYERKINPKVSIKPEDMDFHEDYQAITEEHNQKYDEYLEPDEYENMAKEAINGNRTR